MVKFLPWYRRGGQSPPSLNRSSQPPTTTVIAKPVRAVAISWYSVAITWVSTAPKASLVKGRWLSASEVGGICSRRYEFAETQCGFADAYRMNPPPINCPGNLWAAPFDKGAKIGAYL